jgi:hypothetical protein
MMWLPRVNINRWISINDLDHLFQNIQPRVHHSLIPHAVAFCCVLGRHGPHPLRVPDCRLPRRLHRRSSACRGTSPTLTAGVIKQLAYAAISSAGLVTVRATNLNTHARDALHSRHASTRALCASGGTQGASPWRSRARAGEASGVCAVAVAAARARRWWEVLSHGGYVKVPEGMTHCPTPIPVPYYSRPNFEFWHQTSKKARTCTILLEASMVLEALMAGYKSVASPHIAQEAIHT